MRKRSSFLATFDNSSNDWGGYTIRQVIPAAQLSLSGGTVSIRIAALAGSTVTISECWIDHSASSGSSNADFAGTPTRVTFAGANGATTPSGGMVESDLVPFVLDETEDLVVSMYIPAGAGQNFRAVASMTGAIAKYTNSNAADDPGAVTSGWSASGLAAVGVAGVSIGQTGIQLYDDIFGTTPIKGAWGLRKLVSTYTGPLIRIRDTDDDSEQDVGFNGAGKLDSFSVVGSARVVRVYDQSGGDDLVQSTAGRQPALSVTPRGDAAIDFDNVDDCLYGETAGTARPYMVANPVLVFGMGGGATSSAYASLVKIANADGSNSSPYYRLTVERDSSTDLMRLGVNGNTYTSFDFSGYGNVQDGWMVLVGNTVNGQGYAGVQGTRAFEFTTTDVTYPNSTRIFVAANGAQGENWGGYLTELVIFDNVDAPMSEWQRFAEDIRIKTMVPAEDGIEWRMMFQDNFSGSDNSISFAEIELHDTIGGPDILPSGGTGIRVYPIASFSGTENGPKLFDDNLSTQWSSSNLGAILYYLNFQLPNGELPAEVELFARNDSFYDLMAKLFIIECLVNDEWVRRYTADLTSDGVSAGQSYALELDPISGSASIDSIDPALGGIAGGTEVTILGVGFTDAVGVLFDEDAATSFVVLNDNTITCVAPAHATGFVNITVQHLSPVADIIGSGLFFYSEADPPLFGSIAPNNGTSAGGTAITIVGASFTDSTGVRFGGVSATSVVVVDDNTITCVTPAFPAIGLVDVEIENPIGDTVIAYAFEYTTTQRVTQMPLLIVDLAQHPARVTQFAALILTVPPQPGRITQVPILPFFLLDPTLPKPLLPMWPMEETWQWYTTIATARAGDEQRMALRTNPRLVNRYSIPIMNDEERTRLQYTLYRFVGRFLKFPMFQYQVDITSPSVVGNKVFCDTSLSDFRVGEDVLIYEKDLGFYIKGTVEDVEPDGVILTVAPGASILTGYRIAPMPECKLPDPVGYSVDSVSTGSASVTFELDPGREFMRTGQPDSIPIYDGMPVILDKHFINGSANKSITKGVEDLGNGLSKETPYSIWKTGKMTVPRRYQIEHEDLDLWRAIMTAVQGRQKPFLLPSWRNDFTLNPLASPGGTTIFTDENWVHEFMRSRAYGYIMLHQADGQSVVRKVLNSSLNMDRTVTLTIDQPVPENTLPQVSMVTRNRMGTDEIRLTHHVNHVEVAFSAVSVDA